MSHGRWLFQRRGEFLVGGLQGLFRFNFVRQHLSEMLEKDLFNYTVVGRGLDRPMATAGHPILPVANQFLNVIGPGGNGGEMIGNLDVRIVGVEPGDRRVANFFVIGVAEIKKDQLALGVGRWHIVSQNRRRVPGQQKTGQGQGGNELFHGPAV